MPTTQDLRAVLVAREEFAGDPESVLRWIAAPPRRSILPPALAAAAVLAMAVGVVGLTRDGGSGRQPAGDGSNPSAWISANTTPTPGTAPPATTAPPGASAQVEWDFSVDAVQGYRFTRLAFDAESQLARITPTGSDNLAGFVTVYSPGVTPRALQLSADGQHVLVAGVDGTFLPGKEPGTLQAVDEPDSWPRLLWHYRSDAWAEIAGPFGFSSGEHRYDNAAATTEELRIAEAVRLGAGGPVTMPFALASQPSGFDFAGAETGVLDCLGYDPAGQSQTGPPDAAALVVCRTGTGRMSDVPTQSGDRVAVHAAGDGTSIVCVLAAADANLVDQAGLQAIADGTDTSPSLDDPSTWLPIR